MDIQPGKSYSFRYFKSPPVTWTVDVVTIDRIYLHRANGKKHLSMNLKRFISLYKRYGAHLEGGETKQ